MKAKQISNSELRKLVFLGIIVAVNVILKQISFGPEMVKIGLGFIGSVLLAYLFGPLWGTIGGGITDLIASAIFGNQGGFFIGFTLTAMSGPFIYSLFLYQKPVRIWRVVVATLLVTLLVNIGMNTLWVHLLYGVNLQAAFWERLPKELITPWLQMIVTYLILKAVARVKIQW